MKNIPRCILCFCLLLFPLKFTGYVGNGELPNFPMTGWEWAIFTCYPGFLSAVVGGVALLVTVAIHRNIPWRPLCLLFLLPLAAGLIGLIQTTETDFSHLWLWHFSGAAAFALAICWCIRNDPDAARWFAATLAISGIISVLHGWHQHFWGFQQLREYWLEMQAKGVQISKTMFEKMDQNRVYGAFVDPNVYSAHLLLCLPFSIYFAFMAGRRFEYPRLGSWALTSVVAILYAGALYWSGSRGAMLGLAAGAACLGWSLPVVRNWRWRWALPAAAVVLGLAMVLLYTARSNRGGMASASARMDYYATALKMFRKAPATGVGLGEFFPWYLRMKAENAEVTRNPHSIFFAFLSECGIIGGLAALLLIALPWIAAIRRPPALGTLACGALGGYMFHSLFQFNELIPGTIYLAFAIVPLLFPENESHMPEAPTPSRIPVRTAALLFALLCLLPLRRLPGELAYQRGESADKRHPGFGYDDYLTAERLLPNAPGPKRALMFCDIARYDYRKALEHAEKLQKVAPHRSATYSNIARIHTELGNVREAAEARRISRLWYPTQKEEPRK